MATDDEEDGLLAGDRVTLDDGLGPSAGEEMDVDGSRDEGGASVLDRIMSWDGLLLDDGICKDRVRINQTSCSGTIPNLSLSLSAHLRRPVRIWLPT